MKREECADRKGETDMEKWLKINGRKLLARTLITELDWSFKIIVPRKMNHRDTYMDACLPYALWNSNGHGCI